MYEKRTPEKIDLERTFELVKNTPEAAQYALKELKVQLIASSLPKEITASVIASAEEYVRYVELQEKNPNAWAAQNRNPSGFKNLQLNIANEAVLGVQKVQDLRFDIAISDDAQILRSISTQGESADEETTRSMDKLFNAWLATNDIVLENGRLYQADDKGVVSKDVKGQVISPKSADFKALFADKEKGFQSYLTKNGLDQVTIKEHDYAKVISAQQKASQEVERVTPGTSS